MLSKQNMAKLDILVNNAGITRDNLLMRMKDDEWDDIIQTNLSSVYRLSKAVLRSMMKNATRIISIGSVVGTMGNGGQTNYAAAKAGLLGFTKSLAREVGSRGITVNAVAPGFIETDMTHVLNDEQRNGILSQVPAGRLGSAQEIASAVAFWPLMRLLISPVRHCMLTVVCTWFKVIEGCFRWKKGISLKS